MRDHRKLIAFRLADQLVLDYLDIAFGSLREVRYLIDLSARLDFLAAPDAVLEQQYRTAAALAGLIRWHR